MYIVVVVVVKPFTFETHKRYMFEEKKVVKNKIKFCINAAVAAADENNKRKKRCRIKWKANLSKKKIDYMDSQTHWHHKYQSRTQKKNKISDHFISTNRREKKSSEIQYIQLGPQNQNQKKKVCICGNKKKNKKMPFIFAIWINKRLIIGLYIVHTWNR